MPPDIVASALHRLSTAVDGLTAEVTALRGDIVPRVARLEEAERQRSERRRLTEWRWTTAAAYMVGLLGASAAVLTVLIGG